MREAFQQHFSKVFNACDGAGDREIKCYCWRSIERMQEKTLTEKCHREGHRKKSQIITKIKFKTHVYS